MNKPKIEITPPDISPYQQGNTGITFVTTFDSGVEGPHVMINALTHGNELCGAHTLKFLFDHEVRPIRGKLTLGFANYRAFQSFNPESPYTSRFVNEDFNRLWRDEVLGSDRSSWELTRAREYNPLIREVDHLLDLHSMHLAAPPLLITGLQEKSVALAVSLGYPAHVVIDEGHQAGKRMRDYNEFDDPASHKTAMLVECGQHWAKSSVEASLITTLRFLEVYQMVDPAFVASHLPDHDAKPQIFIEVSEAITINSSDFRFQDNYNGQEIIPEKGTLIAIDGGKEIRTPYEDCVLIMPTPNSKFIPGNTAVRLGRIRERR